MGPTTARDAKGYMHEAHRLPDGGVQVRECGAPRFYFTVDMVEHWRAKGIGLPLGDGTTIAIPGAQCGCRTCARQWTNIVARVGG